MKKFTKIVAPLLVTTIIFVSPSHATVGDGKQPPPAEQLQEPSTMERILAWFGF
jgi:hypothetical protein